MKQNTDVKTSTEPPIKERIGAAYELSAARVDKTPLEKESNVGTPKIACLLMG